MKIMRFTEEQIIAAIRSQVSGENTVEWVSRELGISAATFFRAASPCMLKGRLRCYDHDNQPGYSRLFSPRSLETVPKHSRCYPSF